MSVYCRCIKVQVRSFHILTRMVPDAYTTGFANTPRGKAASSSEKVANGTKIPGTEISRWTMSDSHLYVIQGNQSPAHKHANRNLWFGLGWPNIEQYVAPPVACASRRRVQVAIIGQYAQRDVVIVYAESPEAEANYFAVIYVQLRALEINKIQAFFLVT